jgi:uncharacterized protein (DUF1501 family)
MSSLTFSRRTLLKGCASFAAFSALRGFGITNLLFDPATAAAQALPTGSDLLVYVFVRGGLDGLNFVTPFNTSANDANLYYNQLRPSVYIPRPNANEPRRLQDLDGRFGLHPDAARGAAGVNVPNGHASDTGGLYQVFANGDLAIVHACGSPHITGSHFDSELYVNFGRTSSTSGWIARYLQQVGALNNSLYIAPQMAVPQALTGAYGALSLADPSHFRPIWSWLEDPYGAQVVEQQRSVLQTMYGRRNDFVSQIAKKAFALYDPMESVLSSTYDPAAPYFLADGNPAPLDGGLFGQALMTVARLAKADLPQPLRVACIDVGGGYDTHDRQGTVDWNGNPRYPQLVMNIANNLKAFYDDMNADPAWRGRFTVVMVSEFGRVLYENGSSGTDHGYGNTMLVMGSHGNINGGQVYANWPGLQSFGPNDGLRITTDYRKVLADVLLGRMGVTTTQLQRIFPGLSFTNLWGIAGNTAAASLVADEPDSEPGLVEEVTEMQQRIFLPTVMR